MTQLKIIKHSAQSGMRMSAHDLTIHIVHNPEMKVFARIGTSGMLWPEVVEHNGQQYHYETNLVMGDIGTRSFGGYAQYKIKEYKHAPLTNKEFGSYMSAVGELMRTKDMTLNEAMEPTAQDDIDFLKRYVMNTIGTDQIRAEYIINRSWAAFRAVAQPDIVKEEDDNDDDWDEEDDENE